MSNAADVPGRRSPAARILKASMVPLAAAALVVAGVVLAATAPVESFGWFAYGPLEESTGPGKLLMLTGRMQLGYLLVAAGLLAAAFWGGFRLGRRGRTGQPAAQGR
ncbi:hypothetical protein LJ754_16045 [Arthrobacter sp. zg-Y40]|uniref:hypothetical protein n=1 Tax=Arthrobacter sp. zg-Y40 TaxID=2886939 RepID=UPI001D14E1EB|nr:hypothetical protein [Arthrobacter sp. zg-Y40]MCC3280660.1 hypothetical protein [Arthrobacter sp. zg-Y40]